MLLVAVIVAVFLIAVGLGVLLATAGGRNEVPRVLGLSYKEATRKVESKGLSIEIDSMQDSSVDCSRLKVQEQDPKPGAAADRDEVVTVRLKGLRDMPLTGGTKNSQPSSQPAAQGTQEQPGAGQPAAQPAPAGRTVCLDPGHSNHSGSEIDPATGLNVGDNSGASGELQTMWDLAVKAKARLEQAGYTVRLTKGGANEYASLRTRADIGNNCNIVVRLHFDDTGFTGVMRAPANAARCPASDPSRATVIDTGVANESNRLAADLASPLGLSVRDDTGGTSQGNGTPPGHPTALVGSVLSRVPVVCVENQVSLVLNNPAGQDQVADRLLQGINSYFQGH